MNIYSASIGGGGGGNSTSMYMSLCVCCLCVLLLSSGAGFWKRCEWFNFCGDSAAAGEEASLVEESMTNTISPPPGTKGAKGSKKTKETKEEKNAKKLQKKAERDAKRNSTTTRP